MSCNDTVLLKLNTNAYNLCLSKAPNFKIENTTFTSKAPLFIESDALDIQTILLLITKTSKTQVIVKDQHLNAKRFKIKFEEHHSNFILDSLLKHIEKVLYISINKTYKNVFKVNSVNFVQAQKHKSISKSRVSKVITQKDTTYFTNCNLHHILNVFSQKHKHKFESVIDTLRYDFKISSQASFKDTQALLLSKLGVSLKEIRQIPLYTISEK